MKGIIFRAFIELAEQQFGYENVDEILMKTPLKSNGVYTNVGVYDHSEIFTLANELSIKTGISAAELFFSFGKQAFGIFALKYPEIFANFTDPFSFIANVENNIHVEVLKLYPDAELPSIIFENKTDSDKIVIYQSNRKMVDFAEGLLPGCFEYFNTPVKIERYLINEDKSKVKFIINKVL